MHANNSSMFKNKDPFTKDVQVIKVFLILFVFHFHTIAPVTSLEKLKTVNLFSVNMYICILPKKSLTGFHVEMVIIFPLLFAHIHYTKTNTNHQNTLTNRTIGKCHHSSKELYDSYHWYEWQAPQSSGISFGNCISLTLESGAKAFLSFYFLTF